MRIVLLYHGPNTSYSLKIVIGVTHWNPLYTWNRYTGIQSVNIMSFGPGYALLIKFEIGSWDSEGYPTGLLQALYWMRIIPGEA